MDVDWEAHLNPHKRQRRRSGAMREMANVRRPMPFIAPPGWMGVMESIGPSTPGNASQCSYTSARPAVFPVESRGWTIAGGGRGMNRV